MSLQVSDFALGLTSPSEVQLGWRDENVQCLTGTESYAPCRVPDSRLRALLGGLHLTSCGREHDLLGVLLTEGTRILACEEVADELRPTEGRPHLD